MHKPDDYKLIAFWSKRIGSFDYYIKGQQELAAKERAPLDAIYRKGDGTWATIKDVDNELALHDAERLGLMKPLPDSGVRRMVLMVEVLYPADGPSPDQMELGDLAFEMREGSMVGQFSTHSDRPLNVYQLRRAAEGMGSSADFFGVEVSE